MNSGNNGKQSLSVVVWEWENSRLRWRPYSPEVTQHLERAYCKNLKSVILGDADPALNDFLVNFAVMQQISKSTGSSNNIRRSLYPHSSPAGQGAVWQWSGEEQGDWHIYDMCVQCVIEKAWMSGVQTIDMAEVFPRCPYVINFCNLNQKNKNTGYTRSIRRLTQASYPIGRPVTPQHTAHSIGQTNHGASTSGVYMKGANHETPPEFDKQKRRESREERDADSRPKNESHARNLLNKMFHLAGSSCSSSSSTVSEGSNSKASSYSAAPYSKSSKPDCMNGASAAALPNPLPRAAAIPPVPKPRTLFPTGQMPIVNNLNQDEARNSIVTRSRGLGLHRSEENIHIHQRSDDVEEHYGSNATLNSDCSSLAGARRPSLETISTYLSQDSFCEELQGRGSQTPQPSTSDMRMDTLVHLDDSMSEDEVFSEDKEVQDVMMKNSHSRDSTNFPSLGLIDPNASQSHFVPISTPIGSEASLLNGVKRKRPNDQSHSQPFCAPSFQPAVGRCLRSGKTIEDGSSKASGFKSTDNNQNSFKANNDNRNHRHNNNTRKAALRKPKTEKEKLLVQYTKALAQSSTEDCSICMCSLEEDSSYELATAGYLVGHAVCLSLCGHNFHEECLSRMLANATTCFLQCPNCKTLHGERWGNQPPGTMKVTKINRPLPGYSECGTIRIQYTIYPGIQGPEHPNPGQSYNPVGFPRVAYLPDNDKGNRVLKLLREAFRRRLTFTVGVSLTTGIKNCVTWNEIHHKTEWFNNSGHGYPDPGYLDNVLEELANLGVLE